MTANLDLVPTTQLFSTLCARYDTVVLLVARDNGGTISWSMKQFGNQFTRLGLVRYAGSVINHELQHFAVDVEAEDTPDNDGDAQ